MTRSWTPVWDGIRPHVHPLRTPAGACLSVDAPADHPWHHALWSTIKYVNGENFWEEYDQFGTLRTTAVERLPDGARADIEWVRPSGDEVVLHEVRTITEVPVDAEAYALDWTVTLRPVVDVVLDRTPFTTWGGYGGLTLRGAPDWTDTSLLLPDGTPRERVLGDRAPWCGLGGTVDGAAAGVAILDHPGNPRFPTPWYASTRADTYGEGWANFLNAAFLWDEPLTVPAGEELTLRHRVLVHDGEWDARRIADAHDAWTT